MNASFEIIGLTPELLAEICPVPRSDRRENRDLFSEFISDEAAKSDDAFYHALLAHIRADHDFLKRFSARFYESRIDKIKRKSFEFRALLWLKNITMIPIDEITNLPERHFSPSSPEYEILSLVKVLYEMSPKNSFQLEMDTAGEGSDTDWQAVRDRLQVMLAALDAPDPIGAERIRIEAEALVSTCREAAKQEESVRAAALRLEIAERLDRLNDLAEGATLGSRVASASMEVLEMLAAELDEVFGLHDAFKELDADYREKESEFEAIRSSGNWKTIQAVCAELSLLEERRVHVRDDLHQALSAALVKIDAGHEAPSGESEIPAAPAVAAMLEPAESSDTIPIPEPQPLEIDEPEPPEQTKSAHLLDEDLEHFCGKSRLEIQPEAHAVEDVARQPGPRPAVDLSEPISADRQHLRQQPCDSPVDSQNDVPAIWSGARPFDQLLSWYIETGEHALAWHLADIAEEEGFSPVLPAAVLMPLAAAPSITGPYDASAQRMGEALANAMAAVAKAEARGDEHAGERVRAVAFAVLLRPALLAPDTTARVHLSNLSMRGALAAFSNVQTALAGLGHDFQPTVNDLAELAGAERERRLPEARVALEEWLEQARAAQTLHAPTHVILHQLLAPHGAVGQVVEAALIGKAGSEQAARSLFQDLSDDRTAQERLIIECEQETGRPRRDRIKGTALDWACRKLQDGCDRLQDWLAALEADRCFLDDRRRLASQRQIGAVRKALAEAGAVQDIGEEGIDRIVMEIVQGSIDALRRLIDGHEPARGSRRLPEVLEMPLLRLPGGCQPLAPWIEDPAFADERAAQRKRLFAALKDPDRLAANESAAFEMRCSEGAILPARRLLDWLKQGGALAGEAGDAAEQALAEAEGAMRSRTRIEVETLRLELATLYNLDLGTGDAVSQWLDRLDMLAGALAVPVPGTESHARIPALDGVRAPDIPPDFPELAVLLADIRHFRDGLRARIVEDQRTRLDCFMENQATVEDARALADTLHARDPVTVEDMIAQLQAGLPLSRLDSGEEDVFAAFFPGFVEEVATSLPLNKGQLTAALENAEKFGPLDFSGLDHDTRSGIVHLLERWWRIESAMNQTSSDLRGAMCRLMEALGFTSVSITDDNQLIPNRLRRFQMKTDPLVAERWFLPPVFGSEAGGRYPIFLARPEVQDDQLATELGKAGRERPCLLLVLGRFSRQRREGFARRMRRDKQSVLLIDETQILYLATGGADRMERLFTCAAPFGYLQPYTTSAGNIPREMFFGRREEIDKIVSRRSDGCLVYGGRQLGKSALLHHVRKLYDNPGSGARTFYLKIDVIGSHGMPTTQIWREIGTVLADAGIGEKGQGSPDVVIGTVRTWLDAGPARWLLVLLDETDAFLAAESRTGFPNLGRLKDLMEETGRRFKVVFAGLHNVRRMAQAPNSPLVHLGDPICIGPLNTTVESSAAARRLVTAPMRSAGFDYEIPELAWDILARVNHYPSLVQVFCKALLEGLSNQSRVTGDGPRWKLKREQIFEGGSAQEINRQIRERFQWTLNLDPRYELIAKVLALYRLERTDGDGAVLRQGLLTEEIAAETAAWWPKGFDRLGPADLRAFLDEMVDLGVLARYGARQDRFGLRSAQVAQMLGRREDISEQILRIEEKEPQVDYDAAQFHRRVALGDSERRSPLADRALADLFDTSRPGPRILVAAAALWGGDLAERLRDLAAGWHDDQGPLSVVLHTGPVSGLRGLLERNKRTRQIVILPAKSGWDDKSVEWLARQPAVLEGQVTPICLASPAWLIRHRLGAEPDLPVRIVTPRPWGEAMLRAWLDEQGLGSIDERPLRGKILAGSGGVPVLLSAARPMLERLVAVGTDPTGGISDWAAAQRVSPEAAGLSEDLALAFHELAGLVGEGQEDFATIAELLPSVGSETEAELKRRLLVFTDLGLVRPGEPENYGIALMPLGLLVARAMSKP